MTLNQLKSRTVKNIMLRSATPANDILNRPLTAAQRAEAEAFYAFWYEGGIERVAEDENRRMKSPDYR